MGHILPSRRSDDRTTQHGSHSWPKTRGHDVRKDQLSMIQFRLEQKTSQ